jgi:glycerol-3-phosphate acyltransferase PlsY
MIYALIAVIGYLVGAIPTGFLIARAHGIDDITQHGSGNIGATNVSRVLGKPYFFLVFFLDALKAFLVLYAVQQIMPGDERAFLVAWFAVLLGNSYSIFLGGRGGKGVATGIGLLAATSVYITIVTMLLWTAVMALSHNAGLASLVAMTCVPLCAYFLAVPRYIIAILILTTCWLWWRHHENIKRLVASYRDRASSGA